MAPLSLEVINQGLNLLVNMNSSVLLLFFAEKKNVRSLTFFGKMAVFAYTCNTYENVMSYLLTSLVCNKCA